MKGFSCLPGFCALMVFSAIEAGPILTSQPQPVEINLASATRFSFTAEGAVSNQWRLQGINIPGATNSVLELDNVTNAGMVDAVVYGADGSSTNTQPALLELILGTTVQLTISSYPGGGSNTLTIQLFDHDKPATVENFIHYITSGAYTNMFFDRLIPNFVLQGGDYGASSRTDGFTPVTTGFEIFSIDTTFVQSFAKTPNLPLWVDNEFNVGPLIHNRFGTIAMAKRGGDPDSAESAFFFNLADNSTNLDNQNGGFTVFGRVTSSSNVLSYFNTLSKPDHGIFDESTIDRNPVFTDLPVNYFGLESPVNTNLFYADFSLPSGYPVNSNLPTAAETNMFINTNTSDVQFSGTAAAANGFGLARVWGNVLNPAFGFELGPIHATGTTNWTLDTGNLRAGSGYTFNLSAQDGAGNSTNIAYPFVVPAFPLQVSANGRGTFTPANANGTNLQYQGKVTLRARPKAGSIFVGWSFGDNQGTLRPLLTYTNINGGVIQANFVSNDLPGGVRFTYPPPNARLANPKVSVAGVLGRNVTLPAQVTVQIFSRASKSLLTNYTTNVSAAAWSVPTNQFIPGFYIAQAVVTTASGKSSAAYQNFDVLGAVEIVVNGPGRTTLKAGTNFLEIGHTYSVQAIPFAGASFHDWTGGDVERLKPVSTFGLSSSDTAASPLKLEATFFSNDLPVKSFTITSPKPGATVYSSTITVSGDAVGLTNVTCQVFTNKAALAPATSVIDATITGTNWSALLPGISPGVAKIIAIGYDSQGRSRVLTQTLTVNLFQNAAGVYAGLFGYGGSSSPATSGMFTMALNSNGVASVKLHIPILGNNVLAFPVRFPLGGIIEFNPGGFNGQELFILMELFQQPAIVTGAIGQSTWNGVLFGYSKPASLASSNTPAPGNYVLLFTPENSNLARPTAPGYGLMTVNGDGTFTLGGTLSDDSTFSESATLSQYGYWPLYFVPSGYGKTGMVIGWERFLDTNEVVSSVMYWNKGVTAGYYPQAFADMPLNTIGGQFAAPTNGQYSFVFTGGASTNSVTNSLTFNSGTGQFQPSGNVTAITLAATGELLGQLTDPQSGAADAFRGAFINPAMGGGGFILETNQTTGAFSLTAAP